MIELRDYQITAIENLRRSIASGKRAPILVAPTGSGKTVCGSEIIRSAESKSRSSLFLVHRFELLAQTSMKLAMMEINHNVIAPPQSIRQIKVDHFKAFGRSFVDYRAGAHIGTIQTKSRRLGHSRKSYDVILPDEAHLSIAPTYRKIIAESPKAILTGLTATPWRLDGRGLGIEHGGLYDDLVIVCQPQELIDAGHMAPFTVFTTPKPPPDVSDVKIVNNDFDSQEIGNRMSRPEIVGDVLNHYIRLGKGRPAMGFCANIKQAEYYANVFRNGGIKAVAISGKSTPDERKKINGLDDGSVEVVFNCALYVEGLDKPCLSYIMQLAHTRSMVKFLQTCGRGGRIWPGKDDCIIADHVGNVFRHGLPSDDREWSLKGRERKRRREDDEPDVKIKTCPACYHVHKSALTECPQCGHVYVAGQKREIKQVEGNLVEIKRAATIKRKKEERDCKTLEDFIELGKSRGYSYPVQWATHRMKYRTKRS